MGNTTIYKPGIITPFAACRERHAIIRRERDLFCMRPTEESLKEEWHDERLKAMLSKAIDVMENAPGDCKQIYIAPEDYDRLVKLGVPLPPVESTIMPGIQLPPEEPRNPHWKKGGPRRID